MSHSSKKGISVYFNPASSPFNVISLLILKQTQPHVLAMGKKHLSFDENRAVAFR